MANRLTDRTVEQAKAGASRREIPDALLPGLYLIVQPSGAKSWAVRYRQGGRPRKHTLGPYPALKLATARKAGGDALRAVAEGRDPAAERQEERRRVKAGVADRDVFDRAFADYLARHVRPNLKASSARECEAIFRREVLPKWGKRRLTEITKADVIDLVDDIVDRGVPLTANKVFTQLRTFFNWLVARDAIPSSPCQGIKKPAIETSRERALTDAEVRWLWRACEEIGWPFGQIVKLLLLTGARREEVRAMADREIDLAGRK